MNYKKNHYDKNDNNVDDHSGDEPSALLPLENKVSRLNSGSDDGIDDGEDGCDNLKVDEDVD